MVYKWHIIVSIHIKVQSVLGIMTGTCSYILLRYSSPKSRWKITCDICQRRNNTWDLVTYQVWPKRGWCYKSFKSHFVTLKWNKYEHINKRYQEIWLQNSWSSALEITMCHRTPLKEDRFQVRYLSLRSMYNS